MSAERGGPYLRGTPPDRIHLGYSIRAHLCSFRVIGRIVAILRFPNPGSDLTRVVHIFSLIASDVGERIFDLDAMTQVATSNFQASSVGAQGSEAVRLSSREDRSRDPLYNQMKMYSEVYRMMGLIRPTPERRLAFFVTELGATLADWYQAGRQREWSALLGESLLAITFPNPATNNVGVTSQRPIKWLLELAGAVDSTITRHEMIVGLLSVTDDTTPAALATAAERILKLREGEPGRTVEACRSIAAENRVQLNTLENYTRFPVGVLGSPALGWGIDTRRRNLYAAGRPVVAIELTERGRQLANDVRSRVDVRLDMLLALPIEDRVAFASFAFVQMLARAGIRDPDQNTDRVVAEGRAVARSIGIANPAQILFSPSLQEETRIIDIAVNGALEQ